MRVQHAGSRPGHNAKLLSQDGTSFCFSIGRAQPPKDILTCLQVPARWLFASSRRLVFNACGGLLGEPRCVLAGPSSSFHSNIAISRSRMAVAAVQHETKVARKKHILLTGATGVLQQPEQERHVPLLFPADTFFAGFVGQAVLLDLYRRNDPCTVTLAVRSKGFDDASTRVAQIIAEHERLVSTATAVTIRVIDHDDASTGWRDALKDVTHVMHCAASISYTKALPDAFAANVGPLLELLAAVSPSVEQFTYVSTLCAYLP